MFVFRKFWRALLSWSTRFEIRPFALLPTKYTIYTDFTDFFATELFRVYTGSATDTLNEVFPLKPPSNYNLRNQQEFTIRPVKTVHYGVNSLAYLGPRIWE